MCRLHQMQNLMQDVESSLAEHKRATLNQKPEQSALCVHAMDFEHNIDWINAKILKVEKKH